MHLNLIWDHSTLNRVPHHIETPNGNEGKVKTQAQFPPSSIPIVKPRSGLEKEKNKNETLE